MFKFCRIKSGFGALAYSLERRRNFSACSPSSTQYSWKSPPTSPKAQLNNGAVSNERKVVSFNVAFHFCKPVPRPCDGDANQIIICRNAPERPTRTREHSQAIIADAALVRVVPARQSPLHVVLGRLYHTCESKMQSVRSNHNRRLLDHGQTRLATPCGCP
jgi:hypothetical protein